MSEGQEEQNIEQQKMRSGEERNTQKNKTIMEQLMTYLRSNYRELKANYRRKALHNR